eukprot:7172871-Prymnesium_polylepis.1
MARVGVRIADLAVRRTGVGLAMAARAGVRVEGGGGRREAVGRTGEGRWMEGREGWRGGGGRGDGEGDITDAGIIPGPSEDRGPRQMIP